MKKNKFLFVIVFILFIVMPHQVSAMQIFIQKTSGLNMTVEVETSDTIEAVKEKVYQIDNTFLPQNQTLLFEGKELEDGRTLGDYNISKESTINVVLNKDEEVPSTFDGITNYILLGTISLIGLEITIYLKKRNKVIA